MASTTSTTLHGRISKAFRVRGDRVRQVYYTARRAQRFFRDAPRRAALRALPEGRLRIPASDGYLVVPPGAFEEMPGMVADARSALERFDAAQPPGGKNRKRFLVNVQDAATLTRDSPVIRFALREDVVSAVAHYLGVVPLLTTITVFHSDTTEGALTSSQLHHCDGDDVTQIKIFVYCSDVDARSGPFTLLTAADSARVRRQTGYQYRQRLTDDQVATVLGPGHEHAIVGPAGTAAFIDTSLCFHYGSRVAPDAPARLATMIQYQTPYSFMLGQPSQPALPFQRLIDGSHTPLQRLVLGD